MPGSTLGAREGRAEEKPYDTVQKTREKSVSREGLGCTSGFGRMFDFGETLHKTPAIGGKQGPLVKESLPVGLPSV